MLRALFSGSRDFADVAAVKTVVDALPAGTTVIHGACPRGLDKIVDECALARSLRVLAYPADWQAFGRSAGHRRNRQMYVEGKPHVVYAFFAHPQRSPGTAGAVALAKEFRIPHFVFVTGSGWVHED